MSELFDVIVVGGGPAGYVAAIKAAQLKGKVAVVEKDVLGGTCLNRGCIPTKTYLKTAETINEIKNAAGRGIVLDSAAFTMDMTAAVKGKDRVVKKLTGGVKSLLKANGVTVYNGTGRARDAGTVEVSSDDGKTQVVKGKSIILAGGSETLRVPIPGVDSPLVLTSTEMLDLTDVPERLAIVGGGVIGVEMAQIFSAFGSKVSIIELENRILPFMDAQISEQITAVLKKGGIDVNTGIALKEIHESGGELSLALGDGTELKADKMLLSIGRGPDLSSLGDLKPEMEGRSVKVNSRMETSISGVYAPGDMNGQRMLAHAAFKMGEAAAENALGGNVDVDMRYIPSVVYSHPEAASVGLTEDEARAQGDLSVGFFPLAANGRALASGAPEGFVKVLSDPKFGEILGVHVVGIAASEIINEATSLMAMEITVHELAEIVHGHPSVSEALMEAAADSLGKCIHLPPK